MEDIKARVIKNPSDARKLLQKKCKIIDIKGKKENPIETVFVFEADEYFYKCYNELENSKNK